MELLHEEVEKLNLFVKSILLWIPISFLVLLIRDILISFFNYDISVGIFGMLLFLIIHNYFERKSLKEKESLK